jgi:hypothetical protein
VLWPFWLMGKQPPLGRQGAFWELPGPTAGLEDEFKVSFYQWLMPVILATKEAEIRRTMVRSQPRQIVHKTLSQKKTHHRKRAWWSGSRCRPWVQAPVLQKAKTKTNKVTFPAQHGVFFPLGTI